jgi:hypothetical protein
MRLTDSGDRLGRLADTNKISVDAASDRTTVNTPERNHKMSKHKHNPNRRGLSAIARAEFIRKVADKVRSVGAEVVHLRPNGIAVDDFANVMAKQGFAVKVDGVAVTVAKAKVA